jgi:excinuclease ABC subunit C
MEKAVNKNPDEEYVGIMRDARKGIAHVMILRRTRGVISDRKKFEFDIVGDNSLSSFLLQYYSSVPLIPRFIYVNEEPEDRQLLEASLQKIANHGVSILNVHHIQAKEKRQLTDLIVRNLTLYIERGYDPAVVELKNSLGLLVMPETIDCFDVSNLGTSIAVGACTRFINNKPEKAAYRKFKIKTILGQQNDFAMIAELIRRRYSSNTLEKLPDLIVIDGGQGQLAAATTSLRNLGILDIPCIGLAKENEEIYRQDLSKPLLLPKSNIGLKMLQHIRDEAHRFGLAYNIKLRKLSNNSSRPQS